MGLGKPHHIPLGGISLIPNSRRNTLARYPIPEGREIVMPPWLGNEALHASHRSNLLRKDPGFYGRYGWTEPADLPYVWPVRQEHGER